MRSGGQTKTKNEICLLWIFFFWTLTQCQMALMHDYVR